MSIDADDEIVQDFLIEAGEILEQLNEQLVDLERNPTDSELLNAIFRGFHTIKGGASFLNLTELVDVCHNAEDVFNLLRQGVRVADTDLMDDFLKVLDSLNAMFANLSSGKELVPAAPALLKRLESYLQESNNKDQNQSVTDDAQSNLKDQADAEFESLLADDDNNENSSISEEEFEALVDQLPVQEQSNQSQSNKNNQSAYQSADENQNVKGQNIKDVIGETTVRVDTKRLDDIMNMVGELVLVRNRLVTLESSAAKDEEVTKAVANLDLVTANLQSAVMKTRMQPIKKVFGRFPRVVRDLAKNLQKEVNLVLKGEDTDLDKNLVEALADPLVHLVRNSVDHGIESPEKRIQKGKNRSGTVTLSAEQEGDHILLAIEDDGAGIDPENLRAMAIEKGLIDEEAAARLNETDSYDLLFMPGFSTKTEITDVSGRGVGMDVVKTRIVQLNGSVEIQSKIDEGTRFLIKVPLTLAILPTLMVELGKQPFALPLVSVSEIFNLERSAMKNIDGQQVIMVRDKAMPLFFLNRWLVRKVVDNNDYESDGHVVVVHVGMQKVGFVVDHLVGQEEVVIKPLGAMLTGTAGLAGATITGDGKIALILDVPGLIKAYS